MNRKGKKPEKLVTDQYANVTKEAESFHNVVGQEDLTRFDQPKNQRRKKSRNKKRNPGQNQNRQGGNRNQRSNNPNRNSGNR